MSRSSVELHSGDFHDGDIIFILTINVKLKKAIQFSF